MKTLLRVASSPNWDDPGVTDALFTTESWQTLMTFARESARKCKIHFCRPSRPFVVSPIAHAYAGNAAARPTTSAPVSRPNHGMDEDIPPELYEQFSREDAGGSAGASTSNIRTCPHCTFENSHGGSDCEVCGLPL